MKKIIIVLALIIVSFKGQAQKSIPKQPLNVDLNNGDVRSVLIQSVEFEGWELFSAYKLKGNWVLIFKKNGKIKIIK